MAKFNKFDDQEKFCNIVSASKSFAEILRNYNLKESSSYYHLKIKEYCVLYGVDPPIYDKRDQLNILRLKNTFPLDEILTINSSYNRRNLKSRLIKEKLLEYKCQICKCDPLWLGENLTLRLDHINGVRDDNRLENLRILCPNCHSQTDTYANKLRVKKEKKPRISNIVPGWNKGIEMLKTRKVERPSREELFKLLWEIPTTKIAEQFGVSDKAIEKWAKTYEIEKPPRGYWQKKQSQNNLTRE